LPLINFTLHSSGFGRQTPAAGTGFQPAYGKSFYRSGTFRFQTNEEKRFEPGDVCTGSVCGAAPRYWALLMVPLLLLMISVLGSSVDAVRFKFKQKRNKVMDAVE
jgi:hypothetical protein